MSAHLLNGRINLGIVREKARRELLRCLDKSTGPKALICDDQLSGPITLIADYSVFTDHGVTTTFSLASGNSSTRNVQSVVILVRPKLSLMTFVADHVRKADSRNIPNKEFHIFFIPRESRLCIKRLKELGVYGTFTHVGECRIELFPYDYDLISMHMENAFKECYLENDATSLYHVAKALMTIQESYGIIKNVFGKGKCAKDVYDLMVRMRREMAENEPQVTPQIDTLILIDRSVDLFSPLVTPLTYEGLIDEIFGIKHTILELPAEKFSRSNENAPRELVSKPKKFMLNSGDILYAEIRDQHINSVGQILNKKAKLITSQYEERHNMKTPADLKQFVSKLPQLEALRQSISDHNNICEMIKEIINTERFRELKILEQEFLSFIDTDKFHPYIEECIANKDPFLKVIRLICLQSVTNSGLKPKVLSQYKREILQTYGHQHIILLDSLEKVGLLTPQMSRIYPTVRKSLRTTVEECDERNPKDIAYVHSGYAPLSVRLVQSVIRPGWKSIADILSMLPGPCLEETQQLNVAMRKRHGSGSSIQSSSEDQKVTLVFFLGGCTCAEISALRFLSQLEDAPTDYLIGTTNVVNGTSFIKSLMELKSR